MFQDQLFSPTCGRDDSNPPAYNSGGEVYICFLLEPFRKATRRRFRGIIPESIPQDAVNEDEDATHGVAQTC